MVQINTVRFKRDTAQTLFRVALIRRNRKCSRTVLCWGRGLILRLVPLFVSEEKQNRFELSTKLRTRFFDEGNRSLSGLTERAEALLRKIMHWRYVWNVISATWLLYLASLVQTSYWKFEYYWQLGSHMRALPQLELTPIAAMLFTGFVGILAATLPLSQTKGRIAKICFGTALLLICSVFPMIYLRYGITSPLELIDRMVTVIFFGVYFVVLSIFGLAM